MKLQNHEGTIRNTKGSDGVGVVAVLVAGGVDGGRGERVLRVPPAPPQELLPHLVRPRHEERQGVRRVLLPVEERLQGGGEEFQERLQLHFVGGGAFNDCEAVS